MSENVRLVRDGREAKLTLDRPPLNILDLATLAELGRRLEELAAEPPQLLWLRGAGGRAFSAGVAVEDHTADKIQAMLDGLHGAIRTLGQLPSIAIAVVEGHCLGGGMELALGCDLLLASDDSRFGQPEIGLGCFPPAAAALYPARLGSARTLELLLSGRTLDCREAEVLGLVTWRAAPSELEAKLAELRAMILGRSAAVTPLLKRAVRAGSEAAERAAMAASERIYVEELAATEDMHEGLAAFLDKRPPVWKHR